MSIQVIPKERQAKGAFNGGEIVENKPIGFPREGGYIRPYSNLFYWAYAEAKVDSTIGLHPHEGFEIMSFVLKGNIRHYDTKLQEWRPLKAGDAQIIRAGNGISHAEFIAGGGAIFQIWFDPDLTRTLNQPPSYDDYTSASLPIRQEGDVAVKTYIGKGSPITLDTPGLEILRFDFDAANYRRAVSPEKIHSLYVIGGDLKINGEPVKTDDFVVVKESDALHFEAEGPGQVFMVSSPGTLAYKTYAQLMMERVKA